MSYITDSLSRRWWTLHRFGLTPAKLYHRLTNRDEPRVLCVCIPKSGTHLLERTLCLYPSLYRPLIRTVSGDNIGDLGGPRKWLGGMRPGQVCFSHLGYTDELREVVEDEGIRLLLTVRDPRDVLVSSLFYIEREKEHYLHDLYASKPDLRSKLELAIAGDSDFGYPDFGWRLQQFVGWIDAGALVIKFEDLIGSAGGGDLGAQRETLQRIFGHIGIELDEEQLATIGRRLFSAASPTFRKGRIGGWKRYFDDDLHRALVDTASESITALGYSLETSPSSAVLGATG